MEENVFFKGNLFWDQENCQLIEYDENCEISKDSLYKIVSGTCIAYDIPLSKDVLIGIGFQYECSKSRYRKNNCIIDEDYTVLGIGYTFYRRPIKYLRELQNQCEANKIELEIDKVQLKKVLMSKTVG